MKSIFAFFCLISGLAFAEPNPMPAGTVEIGAVASRISGLSAAYNFEKARIAGQLSMADNIYKYVTADYLMFAKGFYFGVGVAGLFDVRIGGGLV